MPWLGPLIAALIAFAPAVRAPLPTTTTPPDARCPQWYGAVLDAGFTEDEWPTVDRIMQCESHCQPAAYNRSGASGLMQIMPMWHHGRDPFDPATNLAMAHEVYERQGWRAWSCY